MNHMTVTLTEPELHHILAALQLYQDTGLGRGLPLAIKEIATNGGRSIALFAPELQELREKLNCSPWDTPTCQHQSHEDCMFCQGCGECREDLDDDDWCPDCIDLMDKLMCDCGYQAEDDLDWEAHVQGCSLTGVEGHT